LLQLHSEVFSSCTVQVPDAMGWLELKRRPHVERGLHGVGVGSWHARVPGPAQEHRVARESSYLTARYRRRGQTRFLDSGKTAGRSIVAAWCCSSTMVK
jgi:hypothetical protein